VLAEFAAQVVVAFVNFVLAEKLVGVFQRKFRVVLISHVNQPIVDGDFAEFETVAV